MIGRRELITLLGGAPAWPLAAGAQQSQRMRRIGVLVSAVEGDPRGLEYVTAFGAKRKFSEPRLQSRIYEYTP